MKHSCKICDNCDIKDFVDSPESKLDFPLFSFDLWLGLDLGLGLEQALRKPWELLRPEGSQKLS